MYTDSHIAALAAEELRDRRASAQRLVESGRVAATRAAAELRPFAAVACRLRADLADLRDEVAAIRNSRATICGTFSDPGEACARAMVADDFCSLEATREVLTKARDRALDRAAEDPARARRATRLATLAAAIGGCAPYVPAQPDRIAA